ncbi:hypothetical protein BDV93DRAFT_51391 [Ceratobasidium sp. AG-I]|nr:hypothetical protein BDV93DRAFT_51391 [Ceratobasidium sp. AG-I]
MIIDAELAPKSPISPSADSPQTWAPASLPVSSEHVQYHRSYSTFPEAASFSSLRTHEQGRVTSDVSQLLARNFPQSLSDDDQPPAYHDLGIPSNSTRSRGRFWTRCAAVLITLSLVYSTWFSYKLVGIPRLLYRSASNISLSLSMSNLIRILPRTIPPAPLFHPSQQGHHHCHPRIRRPSRQIHHSLLQFKHIFLPCLPTILSPIHLKFRLCFLQLAARTSVARGLIHLTPAPNPPAPRIDLQTASCTPSPHSLRSISRLPQYVHQ